MNYQHLFWLKHEHANLATPLDIILWAQPWLYLSIIWTPKLLSQPTHLKLLPKPRLCCRVWANISYFLMSLSLTERRANFIASSKWDRTISGTGSSSSISWKTKEYTKSQLNVTVNPLSVCKSFWGAGSITL